MLCRYLICLSKCKPSCSQSKFSSLKVSIYSVKGRRFHSLRTLRYKRECYVSLKHLLFFFLICCKFSLASRQIQDIACISHSTLYKLLWSSEVRHFSSTTLDSHSLFVVVAFFIFLGFLGFVKNTVQQERPLTEDCFLRIPLIEGYVDFLKVRPF